MELLFNKFNKSTVKSMDLSLKHWDLEEKAALDQDICPFCKKTDCFDMDELKTCKSCGHVISRPFDTSAEYRFYSNDDRGGDPGDGSHVELCKRSQCNH